MPRAARTARMMASSRFGGKRSDGADVGSPVRSPVARTNNVSPSEGVCEEPPRAPCRVRQRRDLSACALVSRALVATTPIVVASRAGPVAAARVAQSQNGSSRPTHRPCAHAAMACGARIHDRAHGIHGDDGADDEAIRRTSAVRPEPPFIARPPPSILPTVAPAPAPTLLLRRCRLFAAAAAL
jgi:hypothetical protein